VPGKIPVELLEQRFEALAIQRNIARRERCLPLAEAAARGGAEERRLRSETLEERPFGDAGARSDLGGRRPNATFKKDRTGGFEKIFVAESGRSSHGMGK
jgi:hypothetical protein